jgi:hypothetical protein
MPTTSIRLRQDLSRRLALHLAKQRIAAWAGPTKKSFVSQAIIALPTDPDQLQVILEQFSNSVLPDPVGAEKAIRRTIDITDEAAFRLRELYVDLLMAGSDVKHQTLVALAIFLALEAASG